MANISGITDAINRVRTILDRGNSPWMSNNEIRDFISMATNEFVREKVNIFGATQEIRDDLGDYVQTRAFSFDEANNTSHWSNIGIDVGPVEEDDEVTIEFGYLLGIKIEKLTALYDAAGVLIQEVDDGGTPDDTDDDEDVISYESSYSNCKVISLDDAQAILDDPFNKPEEGNYRAVKVGNIYYIMPELEQVFDDLNNAIIDYNFHIDYIADNDDNENNNIDRLPMHSREEICQIASRKILGTTADERYQIGDVEIQQLDK